MTASKSRTRLLVVAALVALAAGCTAGHRGSQLPPAQSPFGAAVHIGTTTRMWQAEVLEVRPGGILFLAGDRVYDAPWEHVGFVLLAKAYRLDALSEGERPTERWRERLRLMSRFPYGLEEARLRELLDGLGQDELLHVRADGSVGDAPDPSDGDAPGTDSGEELRAFVEAVRRGAAPYRDRAEAVAAGYRLLGPDFPGMGEHWVHPGRVIEGAVDPARPSVLGYVTVDGEARLVGVAFTVPLGPDDPPPASPLPARAWHDHVGSVDEETLLLSHPASAHHGGAGYRLSMVHVWTELENRDGILAQNNWVLPFLKRGLAAPRPLPVAAARGLSLADDGRSYYRALVDRATTLVPEERRRVGRAVDRHAERAERWAAAARTERPGPDVDELTEIWESFWTAVRQVVGEERWPEVAPLSSAHPG